MKTCSICKTLKSLDEFPKCSSFKDGYAYVCKICHVERTKIHYENNSEVKERRKENSRKWKENNRERWRANRRRQEMNKRQTPIGKLLNSLHCGVYAQLKTGKKGKRSFSLLGYSPDELKKHLEKQFKENMSWENYGEWHIDHIIPISVFNINSSEDIDFKRCWSLNNLRPLWAIDNMKKRTKLTASFQPSLALRIDNT
jgi:hypothetical protein